MIHILLLLASSLPLWGQGSVTIFGTVTDAAGAVVPGVNLQITNVQTGAVRTAVSGPTGDYVAVQLPVGIYSVQASAAGFKVFTAQDIKVQVNENRRVDVRLELGDVSQNVTVKAEIAQVETRSGTIREVIDSQRMVQLPLNGRNALQLQLLLPGYTGTTTNSQQQNDSVRINGSGDRQNNYSLDGGDNHDPFFNTASPFPNPDALQEFSVNTNSYGADQGRNSGIVVNAVTKSGTNQVHGTAFEFLRNTELNARSFFANNIPPFKRNQYGGTLGGPVFIPHAYNGKDKTFFFVSYQGTKERGSPGSITATTLNPAQVQGNLSSLNKTIRDPNGGVFPGAIIPASRLSKPVQKFLAAYVPFPNRPDGLLSFDSGSRIDDDQMILKGDHQVSSANRASARLMYSSNHNIQAAGNLPGFVTDLDYTTWNFSVSDVHVISPTMLNTFTFSRQNTVRNQEPNQPGNLSWEDFGAGIKRAQVGDTPVGGSTAVTGYFTATGVNPLYQGRVSYQFSDQMNITRGAHLIKFGFDLRRVDVDRFAITGNPSVNFNGRFTGDAAADFLLGRINTLGQASPRKWLPRANEYGAYFQDDWRASRRLTLNLGLRWDPFVPAADRLGLASTFMPGRQSEYFPLAPPGLVFEEDPFVPASTIHARWKGFGPRFGFAYDPFGDGKSSIRGGYGLFFGQFPLQHYDRTTSPASSLAISIDAPPGGVEDPYSSLPGGYPFPYTPPTSGQDRATFRFPLQMALDTFDPNYRNAIVQQWNLTLQRQFFGTYIFTVAYVGAKGDHLHMGDFADGVGGGKLEANPAVPGPGAIQARRLYHPYFSAIGEETSMGYNRYHSLQVTLNKRLAHGFTILANYTFANLLQNSSGDNIFDLSQERGRASAKHRFVSSYIWELPKLKGQSAFIRHTLGGWETNGIITLQSGGFLTFTSGRDNNGNSVNKDRPDIVGDFRLDTERTRGELIARYFNPAGLAQNQPGTIGNAGRGILLGPGSANVDFGVVKNFHLSERARFQYRAEFFNLFNRPNLGNPNTNILNANVARITSTDDPRVVQMALKVVF